jgi:transposase-like protein
MLERLNEELRPRTHVIRIFPNPESCLRLSRANNGAHRRSTAEKHTREEHGACRK